MIDVHDARCDRCPVWIDYCLSKIELEENDQIYLEMKHEIHELRERIALFESIMQDLKIKIPDDFD